MKKLSELIKENISVKTKQDSEFVTYSDGNASISFVIPHDIDGASTITLSGKQKVSITVKNEDLFEFIDELKRAIRK